MTASIRHTTTWMFLALASCAAPAFAQNAAPAPAAAPAATAATGYGSNAQKTPVERRAARRNSEQQLLGAPHEYSTDDTAQGNTDEAQRTALLNEQRMKVLGGAQGAQPARGKGQRKAPAAANGQLRVAGQAGRPTAAEGLMPEGAAKTTYADPYDAGKHAVYRSPW